MMCVTGSHYVLRALHALSVLHTVSHSIPADEGSEAQRCTDTREDTQ